MNLSRLRELHAAWCNGSIRTDELTELRDMLPEVMDSLGNAKELLRRLYLLPLRTKRELKHEIDAFFLRHS